MTKVCVGYRGTRPSRPGYCKMLSLAWLDSDVHLLQALHQAFQRLFGHVLISKKGPNRHSWQTSKVSMWGRASNMPLNKLSFIFIFVQRLPRQMFRSTERNLDSIKRVSDSFQGWTVCWVPQLGALSPFTLFSPTKIDIWVPQ